MEIQLASDIKDILMEDGAVVLPGFGGFTSTYKPAVTDGVMGILHPPSYHLTFDPNQQANDGKLLGYIRDKYHLSSSASQETIDDFVKEIETNFDKSEIVILPEVGRLYRDFAQKIQFLPEVTNFNADTYGLVPLNFSPISRTKQEPVKAKPVAPAFSDTPAAAAEMPAIVEPLVEIPALVKEKVSMPFLTSVDDVPPPSIILKKQKNDWLPDNWRDYAPALAVALVALLAILVYMNTKSNELPHTEGVRKIETDKPNVNVSPHTNSDATTSTDVAPNSGGPQQPSLALQNPVDTTNASNQQFFEEKKKQNIAAAVPKIEALPKAEGARKATIVIGGFANKANIARLKKWINEQGYGVSEKRKSGGITEIGCEVGYNSEDELNRIVKKVKARYGNDIDVYKK